MMSPSLPPVTISAAIVRLYRVITAWMVVTVVSKSSTSWLIDTFITAWSSTMRNWVAASTASAGHATVSVAGAGTSPTSPVTPVVPSDPAVSRPLVIRRA